MEAKEKAIELIKSFQKGMGISVGSEVFIQAKKHAYLCTEEIVMATHEFTKDHEYWYEVQQCIDELNEQGF